MNQRKSSRLKGYDYSDNGAYFITICTREKNPLFASHPELKIIVSEEWDLLSRRFPTVTTDAFVIMPNHVHGILFLMKEHENVGATLEVARRAGSSPAPTIGRIIGVFKSVRVRKWAIHLALNGRNLKNSFWQRNYYDHIIRDEQELNTIREYVIFNPTRWSFDNNNPDAKVDLDYLKKWEWLEGKKNG